MCGYQRKFFSPIQHFYKIKTPSNQILRTFYVIQLFDLKNSRFFPFCRHCRLISGKVSESCSSSSPTFCPRRKERPEVRRNRCPILASCPTDLTGLMPFFRYTTLMEVFRECLYSMCVILKNTNYHTLCIIRKDPFSTLEILD